MSSWSTLACGLLCSVEQAALSWGPGTVASADTAALITGECVASPRTGVWTICPGRRSLSIVNQCCISHCIFSSNNKGQIVENNFLTITSHLKTYDSNNNMSVFSRVYGLDMYLLYALLPVHRQHSLPIAYPDHPPFKLNVVLDQIVSNCSYTVLDREQNYSKCHVFDTSGKLTRGFLR